jgi:thymidylate synthase (FAD)
MSDDTLPMTRCQVPALDALIGKKLMCLNDQGWVMLVDYMGDDSAIVQAARTSYGAGTKTVSEDEGLIRYLMRQRHTTPFEMCELKLLVYVPMDAWRQWIRHRTASVNEYSTRYSIAIDEAAMTSYANWRLQSKSNKQGSRPVGEMDFPESFDPNDISDHHRKCIDAGMTASEYLTDKEREFLKLAREVYEERIEFGIAREQARKDLPLSTFTLAYWKSDLHNLLHFLGLRRDKHAQKEIRDYAMVIGDQLVAPWVPYTWSAFQDYREHALYLTKLDRMMIQAIVASKTKLEALAQAKELGWLEQTGTGKLKRCRERTECAVKLRSLNLPVPWSKD